MADNANIKAHESTYFSMLSMLKYGAIACFLLAFLVIWLIS
ncbi:aa3-type cytochrome c oxidase subunit IV [Sphingomonas adhaesiva]